MIRGNRPKLSHTDLIALKCMVKGLSAKQATHELGLSRSQFYRYLQEVKRKLGVVNAWQGGMVLERYQLVDVRTQNIIEDRREERMDALRGTP